ncbi:uncharacterized protein LOC141695697 [Apium graveolens]|uniref:uncharacterized protein LOC141695697 n=1 Tax=Apium graveolens TaxID=4045 RepID=UPI003D7AD6AC
MALLARRKYRFLDGSITAPSPPCTMDDWLTIHSMLVSWIMNTIDPEVKSLLSNYENAYLLWKDLNERFSVVNGPQIQQLKSDIARCEQSKTMNVATYFGKLKEKRVRGITRVKDERPEVVGFTVRVDGRGKGRMDKIDKSGLMCSHCRKSGHDITNCFELLGYPKWWIEKFGNKKEGHATLTARPGRVGTSFSPTNAGRGRGGVRAHNVAADVASSSREATMLPGFTYEKWQTLVAAFGNPQPPSNRLNGELTSNIWIIDTGASRHVTGKLNCLINIYEVPVVPVGLPDGQTVVANKKGSVRLSENIYLRHVLYVPELNCNLISISQLSDDLNYFVQFSSNICAIQDLHLRRLIGAGERRDGLYYFQQLSAIHAVSAERSSMVELWHKRMGHPYENIVKLLPFINNSKDIMNKACEVCYRAKHCRDSFPLSENKSTRIFELVHCDLWGPYNTPSSCEARYFLTLIDDYSRAVWQAKGDKFASRSRKYVFVGYPFEFEDTFEVMTNEEVELLDNIMDTPHEITPLIETTSTSSPVLVETDVASDNHNLSSTTREDASSPIPANF